MKKDNEKLQEGLCRRFDATPLWPKAESKLGISENVKSGSLPINGLRHPPTESTCGWYIWAGEEMSEDPDFFLSLHVSHIENWCPEVLQYLALPPGWRFQIAPGYEDVWYDESCLLWTESVQQSGAAVSANAPQQTLSPVRQIQK